MGITIDNVDRDRANTPSPLGRDRYLQPRPVRSFSGPVGVMSPKPMVVTVVKEKHTDSISLIKIRAVRMALHRGLL
jgi:hypothetical protein